MHVLITGFEPFGGSDRNPSAEIAVALADTPPTGIRITALVLPVETEVAAERVLEACARTSPDAVVMLGEAAGRASITPELVAINLRDFDIADNAGCRVENQPVIEGGPDAHFATLPVRRLVEASRTAGVPAARSLTAGTFLCNELSYRILHAIADGDRPVPAGFVHVPRLPEQVPVDGPGQPSMGLETTVRGVRAMIEALTGPPPETPVTGS